MPSTEQKPHDFRLENILSTLLAKIEDIKKKYPLPRSSPASKEHADAISYIDSIKEYLHRIKNLYEGLLHKKEFHTKTYWDLYHFQKVQTKLPVETLLEFSITHGLTYEFFNFFSETIQSAPKELSVLIPFLDPDVIFFDTRTFSFPPLKKYLIGEAGKDFTITHRKNADGTPTYIYDWISYQDQAELRRDEYNIPAIYTVALSRWHSIIAMQSARYLVECDREKKAKQNLNKEPLSAGELIVHCGKFSSPTNTDQKEDSTVTSSNSPSLRKGQVSN